MADEESQAQWRVKVGSEELGPVDLEILRHWARVGRLTPQDLVFNPDISAWVPAAKVPQLAGLFSAPPEATPRSVPARRLRVRTMLAPLIAAVVLVVLGTWLCVPRRPPRLEHARRSACANSLWSIGIGLQAYSQDFDGKYPWEVGSSNPQKAWTDLGLLYATYVQDPITFICPGIMPPTIRETHSWFSKNRTPSPFARADTRHTISYGYCYDARAGGSTSWTSEAPATTRLLADKKAGIEVTSPDVEKVAHKAEGRNVLYNDGSVKWEPGIEALDPDEEDNEVGKPDAKDYTAWWSDPPFYGE